MPAPISTNTSRVKLIVCGAAIKAKRSDHGSTIVTFAIQSRSDGDGGAEEADDQALDHERPADEPVGRADEAHDLDLAAAGEDREPDRVGHEQDRGEHEQPGEHGEQQF